MKRSTNNNAIVIRNTPPPAPRVNRDAGWKSLYVNMKSGDWFEYPRKNRARVEAARKYLPRGAVTIYNHPTNPKLVVVLRK